MEKNRRCFSLNGVVAIDKGLYLFAAKSQSCRCIHKVYLWTLAQLGIVIKTAFFTHELEVLLELGLRGPDRQNNKKTDESWIRWWGHSDFGGRPLCANFRVYYSMYSATSTSINGLNFALFRLQFRLFSCVLLWEKFKLLAGYVVGQYKFETFHQSTPSTDILNKILEV